MPCKFGKADKKAQDLLTKGFVKGTKYTTKVKTDTGVEFTAEASQAKANTEFAAKLSAKFKDAASGFSVDKFEIDTSKDHGGVLNSEVCLTEPSMPGNQFYLKTAIANTQDFEKEMAQIGHVFENDFMRTDLSIDPVNLKGAFNVVANSEGFMAGFQGKFQKLSTADAQKLDCKMCKSLEVKANFDFFVGYESSDFSAVLKSEKDKKTKADTCVLSVFHKYNSDLSYGTVLNMTCANFAKGGDLAGATKVNIAGKYNIDRDTSIQGKLGSDANMQLSYSQKLFPRMKVTGTTQVNLKPSEQGKFEAPNTFGLQFDFGDI